MQLAQELLNVGLSAKEADVYLAGLQLGYSSVQEIAERAGINRTTAYTHIRNLISRGLINAVERMGKIYYVAERPEKLKFIYEQQEQEMRRKKEVLENLMPQLDSIYSLAKDKPSARYYSYAKESDLELVRKEIEECRANEMFNIFNYEEHKDYINKAHIARILESVGKFSAIYIARNKVIDVRIQPFLGNKKFQVKFLPEAKFNFLSEVLIADDNVYIAGRGDQLVIKDKLFSQTMSLVFQALWGLADSMRSSEN